MKIQASRASFPDLTFAPYVDVTAWPTFDLVSYAKLTGVKYFTLGFIVASTKGGPSWGGYYDAEEGFLLDKVKQLRELGGDVIVSFGGAAGAELALVSSNPEQLADKYMKVIQLYEPKWVDFDIEGAALNGVDVASQATIERRNIALNLIRRRTPWPLKISYTLPVNPGGLDDVSVALLQNAVMNGAKVDVVNIMAMDYGSYYAPNGATGMGGYAISAASKTREQLEIIGMKAQVGITPMIGKNDVATEVFRLEDALSIAKWAKGSTYVSYLGMWSANRDNAKFKNDPSIKSLVASSLVVQEDGDFGRALLAFQS
ncbi:hypothetical protein HDU67_006556 [Dinochytrium kinnereticum]|nr:hypothetical protein HDU67_006556 [Dinochytrium kinnereticum]